MSHDRGCSCGREQWDYRECVHDKAYRGLTCNKASVVEMWDIQQAKHAEAAAKRIRGDMAALKFWSYP